MVVLATATVAGCCLLISAGQGVEEGHRAWARGSLLRALTGLMTLNFQYPTRQGVEIKWLVQYLGAAAAIVAAAATWRARLRQRDEWALDPGHAVELEHSGATRRGARSAFLPLSAVATAQTAWVALALFAIVSALWAPWPEAAVGEGVRHLIAVSWAVALGYGLDRQAARRTAIAVVVVLVVTAAIGIWYHIERNPYQRLKFPIGNPIFLAACLLPGITLACAGLLSVGAAAIRSMRASTKTADSPGGDRPRGGLAGGTHRGLWWVGVLSAVALVILAWAFVWTRSRGPLLGLPIGLGAAVAALLWARHRRAVLIGALAIVLAAVLAVQGCGWPGFITGRMETVMLRVFAWSYAVDLFVDRPLIGHGQGAYVLLTQQRATVDAQEHPLVFMGDLLGHAHCEWLEILADLGLIGLALALVGLAATFACGAAAMHRARLPGDRWIGFGLLAGFVAIAACEATDVGLRMPGLPVIFYTIIGLIWAQYRAERPGHGTPSGIAPLGRSAALAAAVVAGGTIMAVASMDWQGALADRRVTTLIERKQWDEALEQAEAARHYRLAIEARLSAEYQLGMAAYLAAEDRFERLRGMLARQQSDAPPGDHILELAQEDAVALDGYVRVCLASGQRLLGAIPGYPSVAGQMAEALLLKQQMEAAEQHLGLRPEAQSYLAAARELTAMEYARDPLDPQVALRLFELSGDQPLDRRVAILRPAVRSGPVSMQHAPMGASLFDGELRMDLFGEFEVALAALLQEPACGPLLDRLGEEARLALEAGGPATWPDPYLPETLRLTARAFKLNRQLPEAVELAALAVKASDFIVDRFPAAVSNALIDQANYLLLGYPDERPLRAREVWQAAMARDPARPGSWRHGRLVRAEALLLLAEGEEDEARECFLSLDPALPTETLDRLIGMGCNELCRIFGYAFAPHERPRWFADRLQRSLELLPNHPEGHLLAAYVALSDGRQDEAIGHLRTAEQCAVEAELVLQAAQALVERFPESSELRAYVERRLATQPAAEPELQADELDPPPILPSPDFGLPAPSAATEPQGSRHDDR